MSVSKRVKEELEERYGYDFSSEFWTLDILSMFEEIVDVTKDVLQNTI